MKERGQSGLGFRGRIRAKAKVDLGVVKVAY